MKKYKFRPYFAHSADTVDGFNDGYYLPEVVIKADDKDTARERVIDEIGPDFNLDSSDEDLASSLDVDFAWIVDKFKHHKHNEYSYQYLDIGDAEEV